MKEKMLLPLVKSALPLVAGFAGGIVALFWPAVHNAFCAGFPV